MTNENWKAGLTGLVLLTALGLICPLLAAPYVPLVDPDEGLHASIAQEMVEHGDWVVPHQLGEPFLDKPILYFWAIAASLKLLGNSEAAVRLPGVLFGMLGTLTTAAIAWRMLGRRTGLVAGVFYASMIIPLALVQVPAHDVALVPWINLALLCFWESGRTDAIEARRASEAGTPAPRLRVGLLWARLALPWAWTIAAGVLLGLTILTKGLAGIALVGVAYGGYLLVSRRLRVDHCLRAAVALSIAIAIGLVWYIAVERTQCGFLYYYFVERHLLGFFTPTQPHGGAPWWYYFPILLVGGLPWVGYLPVLSRDSWDRRRRNEPPITDDRGQRPVLFLGCWFVGCTLFLTASHSKLVTYIWPVFPTVAILAAITWIRRIDGLMCDGAKRWMAAIVWSMCLIGPLALPATFMVTQIVLPTRFSLVTWGVAVIAGLTSLAPLRAWLRGQMRWTVGMAAATVCGQLAVLLWFALPQVALALSARDLARHFNQSRELPSRMLLAQERVGSILFYLDRDLRDRLRPGQIANLDIDDPLPKPRMGSNEWIAIPERHLPTAVRDYDLDKVPFQQVGLFRLYRRNDLEPRALMTRKDDPVMR